VFVFAGSYDRVLSDQELRDIVLNFVIAGRDTTAQVVSPLLSQVYTQSSCVLGVKLGIFPPLPKS
jgi:cytochrome P450